jgi:hypothetical protein
VGPNISLTGERDERHLAAVARLEADGIAGGDVQAKTAGLGAIEFQRAVDLVKMKMAADLDGPVTGIGDDEAHFFQADVGLKWRRVRGRANFSGYHRIGW